MQINWFTVIAQIINFIILVWLLKRFLYKPVLNAIDKRENKIASQLNEAEAKKAEAQRERDEFEQKNEAFDKERATRMEEVQQEVKTEKGRLLEEVRNESNTLRLKYEASLSQDENNIIEMIKQKTKQEVFNISGKVLSDLASASLEERLVKVFVKKIQDLNDEQKVKFKTAFNNGGKKITIKSAFPLSALSKSELEKVIVEIMGQSTGFAYQCAPVLISGIEIVTESYQLSWNIESYLNNLKNNIALKQKQNAIP